MTRRLKKVNFAQVGLVAFDFDGVMTDNAVWVDQTGVEMVRCSRADGLGLAMLRDAGIGTVVISTEENPVVSARCRKLKVDCRQGVKDKIIALREYASNLGVTLDRVAFVGNDINDLAVMAAVAVPIAVADAEPVAKRAAAIITTRPGGHGAVREVCEWIALAHTK